MAHTNDTIIQDARSASEYDDQARSTNWLGPEAVFGLTYQYVKRGQSLLDLGIGSGLSSILFHQAGLRVFGLDGSSEILKVCAAKNFAAELKLHDMRRLPLPYSAGSFDHVLAIAVLNSFGDLAPLFSDIARILKVDGIFAFTVEEQKPDQEASYPINPVEVSEEPDAETAVVLHRHSDRYLTGLLDLKHLGVLKTFEFVAFKYPAENRDILFKAYITRKER